MHRRNGFARISPPSALSADAEKHSRLSQRSFGLTLRIWLILALFIAVMTFTHYFYPSSHAPSSTAYSNPALKPVNYLNNTDSRANPFPFCPLYGPGDQLGKKYGSLALEQSRLHLGSGFRVQRVIQKALAGQPVTISIIGGSVSTCHGAGDDPISSTCYPSLFFQWWNSVFPHPATELTNGALRRTDSAYFGYCNAHHLPDVADLIIVELDVDDTPDEGAITHFEMLIRSLLLRPDKPAVLILGHFSPQIHQTYGFAGPDHWHNVVAQFYDIPHISIKPSLLSPMLSQPHLLKPYFADPVLASPQGHALLADTLAAYMQYQICNTWSTLASAVPLLSTHVDSNEGHGLFGGIGERKGVIPWNKQQKPTKPEDFDADGSPVGLTLGSGLNQAIPQGLISTRSTNGESQQVFEEIAPACVSANDLINPLPPSIFYGSGWSAYHPPTSSFQSQTSKQSSISHYWYSTLPTSRLRVPIQVGRGDVGIYYVKEPFSDVGEGSAVECWVDDNYPGSRVLENAADIPEPRATLEMIDHNVARGPHYVECQLIGEEGTGVPIFKVVGIFSS